METPRQPLDGETQNNQEVIRNIQQKLQTITGWNFHKRELAGFVARGVERLSNSTFLGKSLSDLAVGWIAGKGASTAMKFALGTAFNLQGGVIFGAAAGAAAGSFKAATLEYRSQKKKHEETFKQENPDADIDSIKQKVKENFKLNKKACLFAAGRGAAFGAVGGALGAEVLEYIHENPIIMETVKSYLPTLPYWMPILGYEPKNIANDTSPIPSFSEPTSSPTGTPDRVSALSNSPTPRIRSITPVSTPTLRSIQATFTPIPNTATSTPTLTATPTLTLTPTEIPTLTPTTISTLTPVIESPNSSIIITDIGPKGYILNPATELSSGNFDLIPQKPFISPEGAFKKLVELNPEKYTVYDPAATVGRSLKTIKTATDQALQEARVNPANISQADYEQIRLSVQHQVEDAAQKYFDNGAANILNEVSGADQIHLDSPDFYYSDPDFWKSSALDKIHELQQNGALHLIDTNLPPGFIKIDGVKVPEGLLPENGVIELPKDSNPWSEAIPKGNAIAQANLGRNLTPREIVLFTKKILEESAGFEGQPGVHVEIWGLSGPNFYEQDEIPPGYKLNFKRALGLIKEFGNKDNFTYGLSDSDDELELVA